jgi:DNA-binding CsgD family transcriptional regulator
VLFATVERQIALSEWKKTASSRSGNQTAYRRILSSLAPGISGRELDVCVRLLQGMSHDGIACDLNISATTVKTYRNRAFGRLDIRHNNELFALVLGHSNLGMLPGA